MQNKMVNHDPDLSLIFQALSGPSHRAMLARLGQRAGPVSELARPIGRALPAILGHLPVLEAADRIMTAKTGRTRMCRSMPATLAAAERWLADQRRLWERRTARLETYVAPLMEEKPRDT